MEIQHESWPALGRVGVATAGTAAGLRVYLIAEHVPGHWVVLLEHPVSAFPFGGETVLAEENYFISDDDVHFAVDLWGVEWLPPGPEEERVEEQVFGYRAEVRRARRRRFRWRRPGGSRRVR